MHHNRSRMVDLAAAVYVADTVSRWESPPSLLRPKLWTAVGWIAVVAWSLPGWLLLLLTPQMMPGSAVTATIMIAPFLLPLAIALGFVLVGNVLKPAPESPGDLVAREAMERLGHVRKRPLSREDELRMMFDRMERTWAAEKATSLTPTNKGDPSV